MRISRLNTASAPPSPMSSIEVVDTDILSLNDFCDRLAAAASGDVITYYVGMLAHDCWPMSLVHPEPRRVELRSIASRALQLSDAGRVHLLQRRVGPERFAYLAVARPQPRRAGPAMARPVLDRYLPEAA